VLINDNYKEEKLGRRTDDNYPTQPAILIVAKRPK